MWWMARKRYTTTIKTRTAEARLYADLLEEAFGGVAFVRPFTEGAPNPDTDIWTAEVDIGGASHPKYSIYFEIGSLHEIPRVIEGILLETEDGIEWSRVEGCYIYDLEDAKGWVSRIYTIMLGVGESF